MSILITGGHGFVGQNLVNYLCHYPILNVETLTPSRLDLDLMDTDKLEQYCVENTVTTIVHLASMCGGIGINRERPADFIYHNLQLGINVMNAALACRAHIVNLSTVCAYPKYTQIPFKEDNIWDGYPEETNAPYGIAKKTIMEMGKAYYSQYGLNVTNLVPVNMVGPYDHFDSSRSHVVPALIKKFYEAQQTGASETVLWGTGSASREFLYVGDCADAIRRAIMIGPGPEPINIGTGQETTIKDLAKMIAHKLEYEGDIIWDDYYPDGQPRRCLDVSRAKQLLGFEAKTSLSEALDKTIEYFLKGE